MSGPIVGSIYQDSAPDRLATPDVPEAYTDTLARLEQWQSAAFDLRMENTALALLDILRLHSPWMFWDQIYEPYYIGDRFVGQGCRSCDWKSPNICPTVEIISRLVGVSA